MVGYKSDLFRRNSILRHKEAFRQADAANGQQQQFDGKYQGFNGLGRIRRKWSEFWPGMHSELGRRPVTNSQRPDSQGLTTGNGVLQYRKFRRKLPLSHSPFWASGFMNPKSPPSSQSVNMKQPCKHPRVQIVSRDQDSEFVECKECGEIFESSEFKDMNIEERASETEL